jgi:DNA-directed RNA polymerase omega subunit
MVQIPERVDSKYRFVLLASKRAEQIVSGAPPKQDRTPAKPTRLGMSEIAAELVEWDYGPAEAPEEVAETEANEVETAEVAES